MYEDEDKEDFFCPECNENMNSDTSAHKPRCKNHEKATDFLKWMFEDRIEIVTK